MSKKLTAAQKLVNLRNALLTDIDELSEFDLVLDCNLAGINWRGLSNNERRNELKKRIESQFDCVKGL